MNPITQFSLCLLFLCVVMLITAYREGPRMAMGRTAIVAWLFPMWVSIDFWGVALDLRVASGIICLVAYCCMPGAVFRTRLVSVDFAMIAILLTHFVSDCLNEGFSFWVIARIFGEWWVPYVLGRLAITDEESTRRLAPLAVLVCGFLSILGIIEAYAHVNLFEVAFGERPSIEEKYMERLGWRRAFGPTLNPIYFGSLLLLLSPWALQMAIASLWRHKSLAWLGSPVIVLLGIASSMSRAPMIAVAIACLLPPIVVSRRWRNFLVSTLLIGIVLLVANWDSVLTGLHAWSGDSNVEKRLKITVDGVEVEYTSTLHRLYLFRVYKTAISQAGLFGYGTDRTSTFPPYVPMGGQHDVLAIEKLWCIDDQYLLIMLRFGYVGLACYVAALVSAAVVFWRLACATSIQESMTWSTFLGAMVAIMFTMVTVWTPPDFGFPLTWLMGASAGAWSEYIQKPSRWSSTRD